MTDNSIKGFQRHLISAFAAVFASTLMLGIAVAPVRAEAPANDLALVATNEVPPVRI